ncbi:peptidylprolyl isomerase [Herbivorax sp. ANBcel31]|uniref:peptidylprolyl isomerase n=1 Tax=Herbivorax sp. ANBcel31 TaxID=3069754 RepID=UPI0027B44D56|nr:peptidylprolyl isomerase [Herbivorax sp. ANBcel31]MDQ2086437.1 peptidylprolyl isomerase [Herbivorax sp. ANBcel31]
MFRKIFFVFLIMVTLFSTACDSKFSDSDLEKHAGGKEDITEPKMEFEQLKIPQPGETIAVMTTSMGDIKIRLFPDIAPMAVENFTTHAQDGYYDDLIFHRVMDDFMIQGGDPLGTGTGGRSIWGEPFEDEFDDSIRHFRGALSMANSGPNTNNSQFFIVQNKEVGADSLRAAGQAGASRELLEKYYQVGGTPHLDDNHTVFGQVYEGLDVVDEITSVEVDGRDRPEEEIKIISIEIKEFE